MALSPQPPPCSSHTAVLDLEGSCVHMHDNLVCPCVQILPTDIPQKSCEHLFGIKVHIPRAPCHPPQEDWPAWKEPTSPGCARYPECSVEVGPQALCLFLLTPYPLGRQTDKAVPPNLWDPGARGIRVIVL